MYNVSWLVKFWVEVRSQGLELVFSISMAIFLIHELFLFCTSILEPERVTGHNIDLVSQYPDMLTQPSLTQRYKDVSFETFRWVEASRSLR